MPNVRRRARRAAAAALGLSMVIAAGASGSETIDLTERFAGAEVRRETSRIDIGTAAARDHLAAGWGVDEKWGGDATYAWALGERSAVEFFVGVPRPIALAMRCWPLPFTSLPAQTVRIALNGAAAGELTLKPGQAEYSLALPTAALRPGINRLDFDYAYTRRPMDLQPSSTDVRTLAVAWDWLAFDGLADGEPPAVVGGAAGTGLAVPAASAVSFYLDLPPGAVLLTDGISPLGDGPDVSLELRAERDGEPAQVFELSSPAAAGPQRWQLGESGHTRITFRSAAHAGAGGAPRGVRIAAPRVEMPARASSAAGPCAEAPPRAGARPPVLLYLIDTLRADHVGCYGYARATTPHIDAFANDAVRFDRMIAQAPWTKPAVASTFTGLTPHRHGANGVMDVMVQAPTLAGLLAAAGYDTMSIVTNGFVALPFGLAQGFADIKFLAEQPLSPELLRHGGDPRAVVHQGADVLHRAALDWLDARRSPRPFFLYLHASDPHAPYLPPQPFRDQFAPDVDPTLGLQSTLDRIRSRQRPFTDRERQDLVALYDAEIAFTDHEFGGLLDGLRARGLYDAALIIVVADHGEAFDEHGRWQHTSSLFAEQIQVPLLIKFPGQWRAGTVVRQVAQQVDILPTVLRTLGIDPPSRITGSSLLPALACAPPPSSEPPVYSFLGGDAIPPVIESVLVDRMKVIRYGPTDLPRARLELYDLTADPTEEHNLAFERPVESGYLASLMASFRAGPPKPPSAPAQVDPAVRERLRALGYLP